MGQAAQVLEMGEPVNFVRWFFLGDNPFRLYGALPALVWIAPIVAFALWFAFFETNGIEGRWGLVPLAWVLRCVPPFVWVVFFAWFIPHILRNRP